MKDICQYLQEIKRAVGILKKNHGNFYDTELLVAYRGEPCDYQKTRLMPSLFREREYAQKEMHLFELFSDYNLVSFNASNIEKAIETQHYVSISRMLDISFNVLVALYFACENEKEDGNLYAFAFPEHYSPHSNYIEEFYTNVLEGKHIAYSRNFKVFSHSYSNDRIKAQKGGFIFFPGMEFFPISDCYYQIVTISKEDKIQLKKDLDTLFQINKATIYPEKDKVAEIVKRKFGDNQYFSKKVSLADEIETYFNRMDYELKLCSKNIGKGYKKHFLRILRKEEQDLIHYIKGNARDDEKEVMIQFAAENFNILRIPFKEA